MKTIEEIKGNLVSAIVSKKIESCTELLMKYCNLKPQYDGMFARELSLKIINAIQDAENTTMGDDMVDALGFKESLDILDKLTIIKK